MDQRLLQRTRYVLQKRARRTQTSPDGLFEEACAHFINWMDDHPIVGGLVGHLEDEHVELIDNLRTELDERENGHSRPGRGVPEYEPETLEAHAALCLGLTRELAKCTGDEKERANFANRFAARLFKQNLVSKHREITEACRDIVDDLYDYVDEQLDGRNAIFGLLRKYKKRSEHFHRQRLRSYADEGLEGRRAGERSLAVDLHEYLLNQGVEFFVEPSTSSGEADVVLREPEGRYLIADAKYIDPDDQPYRIKKKLSDGFHQVARYCDDYGEPSGFLINFVNSSIRLRLDFDTSDGIDYLRVGGKTIYYLEVRIADLTSASKSGTANELPIDREEFTERSDEE